MNRGRRIYVPKNIIDELEDVKVEKGIQSNHEAFNVIAQASQVGRETERLMKMDFKHKPRGRPKKKGFFF